MIDLNELKLDKLGFSYSKKEPLLQNLNIDFVAGEFIFILGENGSGKSTILKLILGALRADSGEVLYNACKFKDTNERARKIGYVPQSGGIDQEMSPNDMLDFIGKSHRIPQDVLKKRKEELIDSLGIGDILYRQAKKLSGGQKQLINIALGLIHDPEFILLDEPFVGLDYGTCSKVVAFLKASGKTILCVSHDIDLAQSSSDRILFMKMGEVKEYASANEIIESSPYFVAEVDFNQEYNFNSLKIEGVRFTQQHQRLTIVCPDRIEFTEKVNALLESWNNLSGIKIYRSNLKSSLIGKYKLSFSEQHGRKKNKKNKKSKK